MPTPEASLKPTDGCRLTTGKKPNTRIPPIPGGEQGKSTGKRIKGLSKDPYDSRFDASSNYWITDDAKFDSQFPQHELSRLRAIFPTIIDSIEIR